MKRHSRAPVLDSRATTLYSRAMAPPTRPTIHATARELDVLRGIWSGLSNQGVANSLKLSIKTVEVYRATLNKKLQVHNTAGLIREGLKHRLIDLGT